MEAAQDVAVKLGYEELGGIGNALKGTFGDSLKPFK
jgi:hypothetical protein